jgi:hypothetical protein
VWAEVGPGIGECDLGLDCEALELLDDFDAYRRAHDQGGPDRGSPSEDPFEAREPAPLEH